MRCLYCGKELALLKRLTGGGEFCSDAHKRSYQEEYNRLGLSRLLQARSKAGESQATAQEPQKPPSAPVAPVAVAEPVEARAVEKKARVPKPAPPPEVIATPEPPPPAMAGFALDKPSILLSSEPVPYLEPWMSDDDSDPTPPRTPAWRLEGPSGERGVFLLRSGELLPLELQPGICESNYTLMDTATPNEAGHPKVNLSMPLTATWTHEFRQGGAVSIDIAPRPSESNCYASLNGAVDFSYAIGMQVFDLLDLSPAGIAYPAEDCDVTLPESWTNGIVSDAPVNFPVDLIVPPIPQDLPGPELEAESAVEPPAATPRAALEALSKLHQDMREREEAAPAAPPEPPVAEAPAIVTEVASIAVAEPAESTRPEPSPREAVELLAISLKSFAPPKANPIVDANALLANGHPLLPRLKALPLRPKVAPAPKGFGQQPKTAPAQNPPVEPKKPVQSSTPPPVEAKPKAPVADKPAQPVQTSKPSPAAKPAPVVETPKPPQPSPAKKAAQPVEAAKEKKPASPIQTVPPAPAPVPPKPEPVSKPVAVKSAPAATKAQPPAQTVAQPLSQSLAQPQKAEPTPKAPPTKNEPPAKVAATAIAPTAPKDKAPTDYTVPNFGAVVNTSMFGSLKVKAGLAVLTAVIGIGVYFQATGKSKTSAIPTKAGDGVGPSIMVGEGGWVEGWAGDPIGFHNGRQITIYRPSLKLSDYRFEFQGQIESKSIGWIFRAADPENYYAMKLELVSQELPLQLALYKYLVLKGRQVQVGRVPIDVPVKSETVFSIRVDVRGPKFNTYLQGQPVDFWTDDQLRSGGVGFLNERSERGKVKSVSLSYLSGGTK